VISLFCAEATGCVISGCDCREPPGFCNHVLAVNVLPVYGKYCSAAHREVCPVGGVDIAVEHGEQIGRRSDMAGQREVAVLRAVPRSVCRSVPISVCQPVLLRFRVRIGVFRE
jgi:hypothetical protein